MDFLSTMKKLKLKYLGIVFNSNCTFQTAVDNLRNKSRKAMFKLFKSFENTTPDINTSINLFNTTILPILLYNCEIWDPTVCNLDKMLEINTNKTALYNKFLHERWTRNGQNTFWVLVVDALT